MAHPTAAGIVYGGTFDPPHLGHALMASEVCETLGAAPLLFLPAGQNPLKGWGPVASGAQRVSMLSTIVEKDDRFELCSIEVDRHGPSRTYDTIVSLITQERVVSKPWFVIGDELLPQLSQWYRIQELSEIVRFAVVGRIGEEYDVPDGTIALDGDTEIRVRRITNPTVAISSREIRDRLRDGRSIRYLVPDAVYDYINRNDLYR